MKDRIEELIRRHAKACDYLEVHVEETEESRVAFSGPRLEDLGRKMDFGGNVRALHKGGWGFASFNSVEMMDEFATHAIGQAKLVGSGKSEMAEVEPVRVDVPLDLKTDPRSVPLSEKVETLRAYNEQALGGHELIVNTSTRYFDRIRTFWYGNSDGALIRQERMDLGGVVAPIASRSGDTQSDSAFFGSSDDYGVVSGLSADIAKAAETAVAKLDAPKVKGGAYTVILDPKLAGVFIHEAFGHLSEGDNVYEDPKLREIMEFGRVFGRPFLNVYDSGLDKGLRGHLVYDDEGVRTEKTYLIRGGKLVGRLHSRETAGKMGERPTGNARALDYRSPPVPRMRNTVIEAGDATFESMLADVELGVYCISARGGQTNGEMFTFSAANAYMIRDGKIAEMVRDATLTGNVFETLKNIDALGNDLEIADGPGGCGKAGQFPLPVSDGSPHVRIRNVVIGGE
ncbi:MAG: TldD/PmbA family protein [Candidatus Eisenbacteria bacterium]